MRQLGGVMVLEGFNLSPFAISGVVSCSPLAAAEAAAATLAAFATCDREHVSGAARACTSVEVNRTGGGFDARLRR